MHNQPTPADAFIHPPTQPMNVRAPGSAPDMKTAPDAAQASAPSDETSPSRQQLKDFRLAVEAHFAALRAAQEAGKLDSKLVAAAEATREGLDREVSRIEAAMGEIEGEPSAAVAELAVIGEGLRSLRQAQLKILDLMRSLADGRSANQ